MLKPMISINKIPSVSYSSLPENNDPNKDANVFELLNVYLILPLLSLPLLLTKITSSTFPVPASFPLIEIFEG